MDEHEHEPTPELEGSANVGTPEPGSATGGTAEPEERSPNREAANYRRRLRQTEAERDALRTQLDAVQRAEVERRAVESFQDPTDLWSVTTVDQLRGDDGLIDVAKGRGRVPARARREAALGQGPRETNRAAGAGPPVPRPPSGGEELPGTAGAELRAATEGSIGR
jgi:hypothetical protein